MVRRFPVRGKRSRLQWAIYNLFMKKGSATDRKEAIAEPTPMPEVSPMPPVLPLKNGSGARLFSKGRKPLGPILRKVPMAVEESAPTC